ncbi:MAG: sigma-E processing peptidase SpoIIGA [Candidatus Heteroscillospira sp.]|jgi:stage II sporulation protein GA (sporulation sigma-E factor processing peptidase)
MEIIYVDSLFLLNFIIDYLLLVLTFRLCALPIRRMRCVLGALLGGAYAVMCFVPGWGFLASPLCKISLWGFISLAAFGGERHLLKCALSFLTISAVFGGGVWASAMLIGGSTAMVGTVRLSLRTLIFSFALCWAFLTLTLSRRMRLQRGSTASVRLVLRDREVSLTALHDTGNALREPLSGRFVLVAGADALAVLFTPEELEALRIPDGAQALIKLSSIPRAPHFRPVIYSALGVSSALLPAFTPDELWIDGEKSADYVAAVSPSSLGGGDFSAVI